MKKRMFHKYLIFFLIVICSVNAQNGLGDPCLTYDGVAGVCKLKDTCKNVVESIPIERHRSTCHYVGNEQSSPTICCPIDSNLREPSSSEDCPQRPRIPTPAFDNPAQKVAWEKCVANEQYINVCEKVGQLYKRTNKCVVPRSTAKTDERVDAELGEFPHMAQLGLKDMTYNEFLWVAVGSLISEKHVLTVAHALITYYYGHIKYVLLGNLYASQIDNGQLYYITRWIPHKYYYRGRSYYVNDIAVVELDRPVQFSHLIRPICLPVPGITAEGGERLIAGWGNPDWHSHITNIMQKVSISEVHGSVCSSSMICTQDKSIETNNTCQVQSGTPLMNRVMNEELPCNYVVEGLFSQGEGCKSASYIKVSTYHDWIVETVWPDELTNATKASQGSQ